MSVNNPIFFNKSVLDVAISFSCSALLGKPINLVQGTGIDQIMDIDSDANTQYDMTTTGDVSVGLLPVKMTGSVFFAAGSPVISELAQLVNAYYQYTVFPGVITISSKVGGWSYSFANVVFSKPFTGYKLGRVVEDTVFSFDCTRPTDFTISDVINAAGGIVDII